MKKLLKANFNTPSAVELDDKGKPTDEVLFLRPGQYHTSKYGDFEITDADLAKAATNFNAGVPGDRIPINAEHDKGKAEGWVTHLTHRAGDGLYGAVKWTKLGVQDLTDEIYRYVSAEFDFEYADPTFGTFYGPVLTGAGLTNYPLMTNLPPLMADSLTHPNERIILFSQEGLSMNLDEIRAKDPNSLTDEERAFLAEHAAELTDDERAKFGIEAPTPAKTATEDNTPEGEPAATVDEEPKGETPVAETPAPVEPTTTAEPDTTPTKTAADDNTPAGQIASKVDASKVVMMSAAEASALRRQADEGMKAKLELSKQKIEAEVSGYLFSQANRDGKFLPKSKDTLTKLLASLNDNQRLLFSQVYGELPKAPLMMSELGTGSDLSAGSETNVLNTMAEDKVKAAAKDGRSLSFSDALLEVGREHPEMNQTYSSPAKIA